MEYARAIGAESVKYVNALDCQMVTVVEGLDLSVVDLELMSGQTSMVKVTLELGQRRLGNRWGNVLLDAWAGLNIAYLLMGLRGTGLT